MPRPLKHQIIAAAIMHVIERELAQLDSPGAQYLVLEALNFYCTTTIHEMLKKGDNLK